MRPELAIYYLKVIDDLKEELRQKDETTKALKEELRLKDETTKDFFKKRVENRRQERAKNRKQESEKQRAKESEKQKAKEIDDLKEELRQKDESTKALKEELRLKDEITKDLEKEQKEKDHHHDQMVIDLDDLRDVIEESKEELRLKAEIMKERSEKDKATLRKEIMKDSEKQKAKDLEYIQGCLKTLVEEGKGVERVNATIEFPLTFCQDLLTSINQTMKV
jgi:hypothetical protein